MYNTVLLILYLIALIPALNHLVRYQDIPGSRRMSVGLGITGILLAPTAATFICDLLVSVLSIVLFLLIFLCGIGMIYRSIFR